MSKVLTPIDIGANDTPVMLIALVNSIADTLSTEIVTVNAASSGGLTTGNGYISGIFGASVLIGGELRGGAVNASANLVLSSNLTATNVTISIGNTVVNSTSLNVETATVNNASINHFTLNKLDIGNTVFQSVTFQANASANQVFDQWSKANYRSAEYLLSMEDVGANAYQLMKILVIHDGANSFLTEYGIVTTGSTIATVNTVITGANVQLLVSPITATNVELQATRIQMST